MTIALEAGTMKRQMIVSTKKHRTPNPFFCAVKQIYAKGEMNEYR